MAQHLDALDYANKVRLERAHIKRELRAGRITIGELMHDPPSELANMTVYDLIDSLDRWGRHRTLKLLKSIKFTETVKVGNLTERQRNVLASYFP